MDAAMWKRFLRAFAITGVAALALVIVLVLLVDPLGVSPVGLFEPKAGFALKDRRFLVQQLIRSGQFDSFLLGSSTIHSVDPNWVKAAFGGSFANLSIHGATPHELARVLEAVARSRPRLRTIVLGLDGGRWCGAKPPETYHPRAVFPESLYDAGASSFRSTASCSKDVLSISILNQAHCRDDAAVHLGTARHRRRARRPRSLGESSRDRAGLQATHRGSRHDPERVYNRLRHRFGMDAKCRQLLGRQSFPHGYRQGHRASRKGSNRATPRRRGWCLSLLGWARRRTRGHDHALARMNRSREDTA